jgi:DNA-binding NarL/FixJ family response regulator
VKKLRVLLADDHAVIRQGLKLLVDGQPDMEVIGEAGDGQEAWQRAKELGPDVVVMDISMPVCNGVQPTERLTALCPEIKVLALTLYEDEEYLRQLLQAGAAGYVLDRFTPVALGAFAATVVAGGLEAVAQLGSLQALFNTAYGRVLLVKMVLVACMLPLSATGL